MKVVAVTRKGLNKMENEDRIIVGNSVITDGAVISDFDIGVLAIADGVGGHNGGGVASDFVARCICGLTDVTSEIMEEINVRLLSLSNSNPHQSNMATTLSGVLVRDGLIRVFSVGNTRVYLLQRGKYLKQLTSDDTVLGFLYKTGNLCPRDDGVFERKNEITACFGGGDVRLLKIKIDDFHVTGAHVIITSDGIHDYLSIDQMEDIIIQNGLNEKSCNELISAAVDNGSRDDASVIMLQLD